MARPPRQRVRTAAVEGDSRGTRSHSHRADGPRGQTVLECLSHPVIQQGQDLTPLARILAPRSHNVGSRASMSELPRSWFSCFNSANSTGSSSWVFSKIDLPFVSTSGIPPRNRLATASMNSTVRREECHLQTKRASATVRSFAGTQVRKLLPGAPTEATPAASSAGPISAQEGDRSSHDVTLSPHLPGRVSGRPELFQ